MEAFWSYLDKAASIIQVVTAVVTVFIFLNTVRIRRSISRPRFRTVTEDSKGMESSAVLAFMKSNQTEAYQSNWTEICQFLKVQPYYDSELKGELSCRKALEKMNKRFFSYAPCDARVLCPRTEDDEPLRAVEIQIAAIGEESLARRVEYTRKLRQLLRDVLICLKNSNIRHIYLFSEDILAYEALLGVVSGEVFSNRIRVSRYRYVRHGQEEISADEPRAAFMLYDSDVFGGIK